MKYVGAFRVLILVLLVLCVRPLAAYPPPPDGPPGPPSTDAAWTGQPGIDLGEATQVYFRGLEAYLDGDRDLAALHFEAALEILSTIEMEHGGPLDEEHERLRRKAAYLLGKVSRNGEYEILWSETDRSLCPPPDSEEALPEITILENEKTERWLDYFRRDARERFTTYLTRSGRYEPAMRKTLRAHGLPEDLAYLPLIESGYNPRAYSVAHASGIWQFIQSTAKRYDLRVDYWVDERRDPEKSCEAAALHLRRLWELFESWPLVLAAYNAGEKRVMDAVLSAGTRDFWSLRLPRQTRDYVPRYMAGVLIGRNPEAHGFDITCDPPLVYDLLEVDQATELDLIAECCGSKPEVLKDLNPHLRRGCTPPGEGGYSVRIPAGTLARCEEALFQIPKDRRLASASQFTVHRVRRGETLSHIASRYGTTVSQIAAANNLRNQHFIREGQKLTVPTPGHSDGTRYAAADEGWREDGEKIVYVVRRGDTLGAIARVYRTHVDQIRKWNGLGRNQHIIHPGDRLLIFVPKGS